MSAKIIALFILSIIAGIVFIGVGFYFLSTNFVKKMIESNPFPSEDSERKTIFRAKASGYTALATGALTLMWGIFIFIVPQIISILALIYMLFLIIAFSVLTFVFK